MNKDLHNKRHLYLSSHCQLYILPVYLVSCSYVWAVNTDAIIANGTVRTIENITLANGTNGNFIIEAKNGADLTATNVELNSSSIHGGGAWVDNSKLTAQGLQINVTGHRGAGLYLANSSVAAIDNMTITGQGSANGLVLDGSWSGMGSLAKADITDGTITIDSGEAIRVSAGELTLKNVSASTQGNSSYAVNVNSNAKVVIEGGDYFTQGAYSDAVWVASSDSSVTVDNATITTQGDRSIAVNAQRGRASVTNSTLEAQGENAYGLYTESQIQGDGLAVTTTGTGGAGMFTASGGQGRLNNSTIATYGKLAPGLLAYPGSKITANNVEVNTAGNKSFGVWSHAGTLDISNSLISTSGYGASGLFVNGYSSSLKNDVSLDNVMLHADQAQAIQVDTTNLVLEVKNSVLTGGNGQLMTVSNYEDALDPANNLYSDVTFSAVNSTLNGDISVSDPGNAVVVNLASGSVLTGAVTHTTSLVLDDSSRWNMSNSSSVGQLINNGTITFSDVNKFDTLTVTGNYLGDGGLLVMNSVLGDDGSPSNKLIVGGDVLQGTTRISINNLGGYGAKTVEGIEIVDVGGTSIGNFVKSGRIVAGAYDYDLVRKGESWYLTSQLTPVDPAPTPDFGSTAVVRPEGGSYIANLAAGNTLFMMTLHDRLGEPQFSDTLLSQREITSLWLRQVGGHNVWRDGSGQLKTQSNRYVAQLGGDVARWSTDGTDRWHVGFMTGYANSHSTTDNRVNGYHSKGSVKGYSVGGYATWYANQENHTGAWLDSWLQYSWFNNEVSGEKLAAEIYKSHGFTASLEGGYTWKTGQFWGSHGTLNEWFVQPQIQAVWMGVRADDHQEANGTRIQGKGDGNWMTRMGIKTWLNGHHMRDNVKQREFQPYIALNWLHNTRNFATKMDGIRVSQNGATNLAEVKIGLEGKINPRLNVWGNVGVQIGDAGYNDTAAIVGMKYNF
ncbi:autotransporter outer membrane beta-barrel domain-containing protein [Pantoea sp. FN0307]|uniref:autotransporter outer membrane beta-barrel domain-containing protein n=1 Tax=Pantoea sp. FN0307 TaxID=3418560 RepID=UPI003CF6DD92